jgi:tRNA threonylcarbamoyladenosine biosynthesis protein TsaE
VPDEDTGRSEQTRGGAETEALGARIARSLRPGDAVLVSGELGAGKTTLIRGACRELGVGGPVSSPTFAIGRRYGGEPPVSHLDLYRLGSLDREDPGLLDDYLSADTIAFVEWPQVGEKAIAWIVAEHGGRLLRVELRHAGGEVRDIGIEDFA